MTLSDKQWLFLQNVAKLIEYAQIKGYKLTGGELKRPGAMQLLYFFGKDLKRVGNILKLEPAKKLSKTLKSDHLNALAIDLNVFYDIDGDGTKEYAPSKEITQDLGDFWKSLHVNNYWGGDWGWDTPHFGMKE